MIPRLIQCSVQGSKRISSFYPSQHRLSFAKPSIFSTQKASIHSTTESPSDSKLDSEKSIEKTLKDKKIYKWILLVGGIALLLSQVPINDLYINYAVEKPETKLKMSFAKWALLLDQCSIANYLQSSSYLTPIFGSEYSLHFPALSQSMNELILPSFLGGSTKVSNDAQISTEQFDFVSRVEITGSNGRQGTLYLYRTINQAELTRITNELSEEGLAEQLDKLMQTYLPAVELFPSHALTPFDRMKIHKAMEDDIPGQLLRLRFASLHIEDLGNSITVVLSDRLNQDITDNVDPGFEKIGINYFEEPEKRKKWLGIW